MAFGLNGTKPSSEPMQTYSQLDPGDNLNKTLHKMQYSPYKEDTKTSFTWLQPSIYGCE